MATNEPEMRVALGGFMGVGKSTVGRLLSRRLLLPFRDSDEYLVGKYGPINRQFAKDGESVFRDREAELIEQFCAQTGAMVLATGGGVFAEDVLRNKLRAAGFSLVVLTSDFSVLCERVGRTDTRPKWSKHAAKQLFEERSDAYTDVDFVVDTTSMTVDGVCSEVLMRLGWEERV